MAKNGGDERIGLYKHFVTIVEQSHLFVGSEGEGEGVKSIGHTDAMAGADILGIVLFELLHSLSLQIPAAIHDCCYCLLNLVGMQFGHRL